MTLAVITIAHQRHDHLRGQVAGLAAGEVRPDLHVVAAMDDPALGDVARDAWALAEEGSDRPPVDLLVVDVPHDPLGLPLARARNLGAEAAVRAGAGHLVLLDVDCIPGPTTVSAYAQGLAAPHTSPAPRILQGDVAYLPPAPGWQDRLDTLHLHGEHREDRERLPAGELRVEPDLTRFWSLSFALTSGDLELVGGFCTDYVGYGGEDTDFAQLVGRAGGSLVWVGGATAYHQHHPSTSPPLQHLEAVVRNANLFAERWGWWPMEGWLEGFRALGLADRDPSGRWVVTT